MPDLCSDCHAPSAADLVAKHAGADLTTAKCTGRHTPHAARGAGQIAAHAHPGFADRDCSSCHAADQPPTKTTLAQPVAKLCAQCHDVARPSCIGCHRPHAAEHAALLAYDPKRELCIQCHDPNLVPLPKK